MRKLHSVAVGLAAASSVVALSASAFADGVPGRGPRAPIEAPFSWTGFYGGANLGVHWIDGQGYTATPSDALTAANFNACTAAGTCPTAVSAPSGTGAIGGIQAGYNWQMQSFLLGFEADIQGSTAGNTRQNERFLPAGAAIPGGPVGAATAVNHTAATTNVEWIGTVRARLGLLISPTLLAYVTGGWAFGGVERTWGMSATGGAPGPVNGYYYNTFGRSTSIESGYTVGGGLEWAITNRVTLGGEYLYVNLGGGEAFGATSNGNQGAGCTPATPCNFGVRGGDTDNHIGRVKLNYKF